MMTADALPDEALKVMRERIREVVDAAGGPKAFSELSGVPFDTLNKYLSKSQPGPSALIKISRAARVSADYILGVSERTDLAINEGDKVVPFQAKTKYLEGESDFVKIPHLSFKASAGGGRKAHALENIDGSVIAFRNSWLYSLGISSKNAEFIKAQGDSMEPTIMDGDIMLIDRGYGRVANGKIYVLVVSDAVIVKRINLLATGGVMLISDNDRYPPEVISSADVNALAIEGRVRWYGRAI